MRSSSRFRGALAAAVLLGLGTGGTAAAASAAPAGKQTVTYQGYTFTVPASWPVIDLGKQSDTCVRYDRHAVYLGKPGPAQNCPAHLFGRTEALLIQPGSAGAAASIVRRAVSDEFDATAPGIEVTGTYRSDAGQIAGILTRALPAGTAVTDAAPSAAAAHRPAVAASSAAVSAVTASVDFTGEGFDACTAPSESDMAQWRAKSPYDAIGLYIGGAVRTCAQPNLTAQWVSDEANAGWHFWLMYAGPQSPDSSCGCAPITDPASQAESAAQDAVGQAVSLGFPKGVALIYDMEAYTPSTSASATVLAFEADWTADLHSMGYQSGVYGSMASTVQDLVGKYGTSGYTEPDVLAFASGDGQQNTNSSALPSGSWPQSQRINQNAFGLNQQFGTSSTINIDTDYVDVQRTAYNPPGGTVYALAPGTHDVMESVGTDPSTGYDQGSGKGWITIGGPASDIFVGDGDVYAVNPNNTAIYLYDASPGAWTKEGAGGAQFAMAGGILYGLTADKAAVYEFDGPGHSWKQVGAAASAIYGGPLGLFATNPANNALYGYDAASGSWTQTGGGGSEFAEVGSVLYGLATNHSYVAQWSGSGQAWTVVGGPAANLYGSPDGIYDGASPALYATTSNDSNVYQYLNTPNSWGEIGPGATTFASTRSGLYALSSGTVSLYHPATNTWANADGSAAWITGIYGRGNY